MKSAIHIGSLNLVLDEREKVDTCPVSAGKIVNERVKQLCNLLLMPDRWGGSDAAVQHDQGRGNEFLCERRYLAVRGMAVKFLERCVEQVFGIRIRDLARSLALPSLYNRLEKLVNIRVSVWIFLFVPFRISDRFVNSVRCPLSTGEGGYRYE